MILHLDSVIGVIGFVVLNLALALQIFKSQD
jgi:hypothetical protein